jgi:uncharacterized glyoxalase superfamily protein PhnB
LGFIRLEVSDLEQSLMFYRRGLRFAAGSLGEEAGHAAANSEGVADVADAAPRRMAALTAGTLRLILEEVPAGQANGWLGQGVDLAIEVSGVDVYHDALVARGIQPTPPIDEAGQRSFRVRDPDGYQWRIQQSLD